VTKKYQQNHRHYLIKSIRRKYVFACLFVWWCLTPLSKFNISVISWRSVLLVMKEAMGVHQFHCACSSEIGTYAKLMLLWDNLHTKQTQRKYTVFLKVYINSPFNDIIELLKYTSEWFKDISELFKYTSEWFKDVSFSSWLHFQISELHAQWNWWTPIASFISIKGYVGGLC
jgi:hypothetical protein